VVDDLACCLYGEQNQRAAEERRFKQRSCNMSLIALFPEHFWLLFAVAISIAVLRELHLKRD
jgi:hypothetical protein